MGNCIGMEGGGGDIDHYTTKNRNAHVALPITQYIAEVLQHAVMMTQYIAVMHT